MNVREIDETIKHFQDTFPEKWLVVILDHTLLVEFSLPETEQSVITKLQKVFIGAKKIGRTSIIQLSQMNREIEKAERINNNLSHFPLRSDISTSDKIFHASDYVFVIHRPETLGITHYGKELIPSKDKVFLHTHLS